MAAVFPPEKPQPLMNILTNVAKAHVKNFGLTGSNQAEDKAAWIREGTPIDENNFVPSEHSGIVIVRATSRGKDEYSFLLLPGENGPHVLVDIARVAKAEYGYKHLMLTGSPDWGLSKTTGHSNMNMAAIFRDDGSLVMPRDIPSIRFNRPTQLSHLL
jgi:hypothetical protein